MVTTNQYDFINRLLSKSSGNGLNFAYPYGQANQRAQAVQGDGSRWQYDYDRLGQVTSGKKYWADWTPVAGEQFEYAFDDIGNRTGTKAGGDATGYESSLRSASYTVNNLNQYTSRTVPGAVDIMGLAYATAGVTVNGNTAYRKGEFYDYALTINNSSAPAWQSVTVDAFLSGTTNTDTGNVFLPQTPESFGYDADGNMTNDGHWSYIWDAENRLLGMQALSTVPDAAKYQLGFAYDWQGRRIAKIAEHYNGSGWTITTSNAFAYDGWNLVAELNATNNALIRSYLWGLDLSGTPQAAGGVGGLLEETFTGSATTNCFVAFDGNGNVAGLVNAADGTILAQYEYGPFGEPLRASGPTAKLNPLRFSTEYQDDEDALVCYPHRYLNKLTGRWLSRDMLDEPGFDLTDQIAGAATLDSSFIDDDGGDLNLYSFVNNGSVNLIDGDGLETMTIISHNQFQCGGWANVWLIDPQISKGSLWLVQRVRFAADITDCNPAKKNNSYPAAQWWEAIKLTGGSSYSDNDQFTGAASAFGRAQIDVASAIYKDSKKLRSDIKNGLGMALHNTDSPPCSKLVSSHPGGALER